MRSKILAATTGLAIILAACGESQYRHGVGCRRRTRRRAPKPADDATTPVDVLAGDSSLGPILAGPGRQNPVRLHERRRRHQHLLRHLRRRLAARDRVG